MTVLALVLCGGAASLATMVVTALAIGSSPVAKFFMNWNNLAHGFGALAVFALMAFAVQTLRYESLETRLTPQKYAELEAQVRFFKRQNERLQAELHENVHDACTQESPFLLHVAPLRCTVREGSEFWCR